jgi:hypothetical protein
MGCVNPLESLRVIVPNLMAYGTSVDYPLTNAFVGFSLHVAFISTNGLRDPMSVGSILPYEIV